ncbi:MAG: RNA-binding transcriptional accessory protein [Clostridia bacterium]|nr:RNA-binding transcriptional accessory protein [Clostridia bacterium]
MTDVIKILSEELNIKEEQVKNTVELLDEGNTLPFIARYRKEVTGGLDDTVLRTLEERLNYLRKLDERRGEVTALIEAQGKMTEELAAAIAAAATMTEIDDIYRPYRPKRKTRASVARERGLEPLALLICEQRTEYETPIAVAAEQFTCPENGIETAADAIAGACDIIAEDISDNAEYRKQIRSYTYDYGMLVSKAAKEEDSVYSLYYDFSEKVRTLPGHRILAINRGEKEEFLKVTLELPSEIILNYLFAEIIKEPESEAKQYLMRAMVDGYERLIAPSVEREIRNMIFDEASEGAITVFSDNLKHLLMQSPLKGKTVMGYDPGYRTGCKLAVVDHTGRVLDTAVIYPTKPREDIEGSRRTVLRLIKKYDVEVVAIGNGTASKESEIFIAELIRDLDLDVKYAMVSEAGASVYSASKLAAEEFPDFDVTQRSAVSIARRLQDPLAELVKIDPKSIGVGQYQHDMKPARLDESLYGVVEDCVNSVGVDLNTASHSLLSYIAGINSTIAKNIIKYREENGEFISRSQLKKVPRLGDKAYQQCAGFLRVSGGREVLDNTAVHPESYPAAKGLLTRLGYTEDDISRRALGEMRQRAGKIGLSSLCEELGVGEPTLKDIMEELEKPGRDPRDTLPKPVLRTDILDINDLKPDMMLTGTVRNVIDFGAFVDIGVHQDGLIHISEMSDKYVKHPSEVLSVGDIVTVRVKSVDVKKSRIGLSLLPADKK